MLECYKRDVLLFRCWCLLRSTQGHSRSIPIKFRVNKRYWTISACVWSQTGQICSERWTRYIIFLKLSTQKPRRAKIIQLLLFLKPAYRCTSRDNGRVLPLLRWADHRVFRNLFKNSFSKTTFQKYVKKLEPARGAWLAPQAIAFTGKFSPELKP